MNATPSQPSDEPKFPQRIEDLTHTTDWHGAPDLTLASMSDFADGSTAGVDVTLIVPGGLLSGAIESAQDYFTATATNLRQGVAQHGDEDKDKLADSYAELFFDNAAKVITARVDEDKAACEKGEIPPPRWPLARYIHLGNAHFSTPGQFAFELGHVRVLLSQVIGWTLGEKRSRTHSES
jgi:hypothetical protein